MILTIRIPSAVRAAAATAILLIITTTAAAGDFFDDVPTKSYVREDVALDVVSVSDRGSDVVARVRFLRLVLDPGRRDVASDLWPQREMLLVERASGERVVFERLTGIPLSTDVPALTPQGRVGLERGAVETFARTAAGSCAALDGLIRSGSLDLPVAREDLSAPTVRLGIAQALGATLDDRDIDVIGDTVPILLRAESQGLPLGPLKLLEVLFPGRTFARSTAALTFRVSAATPPNPADAPWSSMTQAPELTPGVPAY
jgi:hypothetical protein